MENINSAFINEGLPQKFNRSGVINYSFIEDLSHHKHAMVFI
ncbi:MAG: hypothetical protein ACK4ND_10825 [Cytophagaceae bacterium]